MSMKITEEQQQILNIFICERLSSDDTIDNYLNISNKKIYLDLCLFFNPEKFAGIELTPDICSVKNERQNQLRTDELSIRLIRWFYNLRILIWC